MKSLLIKRKALFCTFSILFVLDILQKCQASGLDILQPEDHWSCIVHLIAEDMLKSAVIEEKTFKHSPWSGTDNPLGPKF